MAEQYWIGGFHIDLSRNQISQNNQPQTLAPKALAVLTCLAENQGKVVSQETLLDKVWQGTVVSPNTLQRSIAQLRKALGDDGKVQVYIKTHAKQGYSLECDVRWQDHIQPASELHTNSSFGHESKSDKVLESDNNKISDTSEHSKIDANTRADKNKEAVASSSRLLWSALILTGVMLVAGYLLFAPKQPASLSFGELRALTATDHKEFAGIYSPDGKYVVFHRYTNMLCRNAIWAKNLETQQEFQLTENLGSYGSHSFSKDGKKLVLIQSLDCNKPITQKKCYKLMSLDFNKALKSPQAPTELMECKNSAIRDPIWLNNNNVALLHKSSKRWQLLSYSITENSSQVLYTLADGNILDYDYSVEDDLIALTGIHSDEHYYIDVLKSNGELVSSHKINYPDEITQFRRVRPNFSPLDKQLIFSTGRQLFTLSYDGQVSNISLLLDEPMGSPTFHPNGKRMIVIKGHYDSDIIAMPVSQNASQGSQKSDHAHSHQARQPQQSGQDFLVLYRSTAGEDNAKGQPDGELIAFTSRRSGEAQIWLASNEGLKQLTNFPMDTYISGMDWAADGKSLLVNANYQLSQVFLDGSSQHFPLTHAVEKLLQWDSENNTALTLMRVKGIAKLVEISLANAAVRVINDKSVNWAAKTGQGQLVYTDQLDRFWLQGAVEDELIEALNGQGSDKRFLIKNDTIYGVNDNFQLWRYHLDDGSFTIIGEAPDNLDHITDVHQAQLFGIIQASARKALAELFLTE